jgi:hypothetical protein
MRANDTHCGAAGSIWAKHAADGGLLPGRRRPRKRVWQPRTQRAAVADVKRQLLQVVFRLACFCMHLLVTLSFVNVFVLRIRFNRRRLCWARRELRRCVLGNLANV